MLCFFVEVNKSPMFVFTKRILSYMLDDTANSGIDPIPSEYRAIIVKHTKAGYVGESSVL